MKYFVSISMRRPSRNAASATSSTILPIPVFWRKPRRAVARDSGKTNRYELEVKAETVLDNLADESRVVDIITDMLRPKMKLGDGASDVKPGGAASSDDRADARQSDAAINGS